MPLDEVLLGYFPWCAGWSKQLRELFSDYVEAKQRQHVLDYDDLLLYWAQTVSNPILADDICGRFDHVLVDEYQDTNRLQSSILLALRPRGVGLTVVGDDAQSIYSSGQRQFGTFSTFPASSARPPKSSRWIGTIGRPFRFSRRRTRSLVSPRSVSPRISGRTDIRPSARNWSAYVMRLIRPAMSSIASSPNGRLARL